MAKIEQFSRIINHGVTTAGTVFTIPTSNDHTDETWITTDLYIGEIGINLTDDKIFMRTNNGVVQLATGTSSGSTASQSPFVFNSPNIQIGSTFSADAVLRNSTFFTDLGSTSLRWKDLYLGGSSLGLSTIDVNGGLRLRESSNGILTTNGIAASNAPIEIHATASLTTKDRGLHLNSRLTQFVGSSIESAFIGCVFASMSNSSSSVFIGAQNVNLADGLNSVVHLGIGLSKTNHDTETVYAGGGLAIRGAGDDGSTQYNQSDWITRQAILRTTDANTFDIATIPWVATASGGNVVQVKAYVVCNEISDAALVYSAEILGCYSIDQSGDLYEIGTPVINEQSSFADFFGTDPEVELASDNGGLNIKVTGLSTQTIQWLVTFSFQRLMNIV